MWKLYFEPAIRRSRKSKRKVRGKADRLPNKEEYVLVGLTLGGNREALEAEYDRVMGGDNGGNPG